jgi:hypothetical protein
LQFLGYPAEKSVRFEVYFVEMGHGPNCFCTFTNAYQSIMDFVMPVHGSGYIIDSDVVAIKICIGDRDDKPVV